MKWIKAIAVLPFLGFLGGAIFLNNVTPFILGLPFFVFWCALWVVLSSIVTLIIYWFDPDNREGKNNEEGELK